jgi:Domain of unknown function (DUF1814).
VAIDPFQADVARIALAAAQHGFALAGGNALVAHGVVERPTEDVDLFTPEPGGPGAVAYVVRDALTQAGYQVDITRLPEAHQGDSPGSKSPEEQRRCTSTWPRDWRQRPPVQLEVGPVLHLEDAVSSKTTALVTRREPRDFIDIAAALDRYGRAELMRLTFTRDRGLRVVDFPDTAQRLDQFTTVDFAEYDFDQAALDTLRARFADWPRHEADDHEGQAIHAGVAAEEGLTRTSTAGTSASTLAGQAYPAAPAKPPTGRPPAGYQPPESRHRSR